MNERMKEQADKKTKFCSGRTVQYIFIRNVMKQQREEVSVSIFQKAIAKNNKMYRKIKCIILKKRIAKVVVGGWRLNGKKKNEMKKEQKRRTSLFVRHSIESTRVLDKKKKVL